MNIKNLIWNIEGFSRNLYNLLQLLQDEYPSLIFISEPWLHLSDAPLTLKQYLHQYNYFLNSEDRHDDLLSLSKSRTHGGTLALWKKDLDPYITVLEPSSSRVLALLLDIPGYQVSIHITVYLSTSGKDSDFMKDLAHLQETIDIVSEKYPESLVFVIGDFNASVIPRSKNKRDELFTYFVLENKFASIEFSHKTYHHFTINGLSDSNIDVILYPEEPSVGSAAEVLNKVICGKTNPLVDSSHDVLISTFPLHFLGKSDVSAANVTAPRVQHTIHKVVWSEEGIAD